VLGEADTQFLTWLVDLVAPVMAKNYVDKEIESRFSAILLTVFGLEEIVAGALSWTDADFLSLCRQCKPTIRRSLIVYWTFRVDFLSIPDEYSEAAVTQTTYMSQCLLHHLGGEYDSLEYRTSELDSSLSSGEFLYLADRIHSLELDTDADVLAGIGVDMQKAIYDWRTRTLASHLSLLN
jgi:hypothetical protein